jgi:hypothetical protein
VSLWWNLWADAPALVDRQTTTYDTPVSGGGHPMPETTHTITVPLDVRVKIARLNFRPGNCDGLSPTWEREVLVTITPDLSGTEHYILFDIVNSNATNGTASVIQNAISQSSRTITVRGDSQTVIGGGAQLQVRARLNGEGDALAYSEPFAVFALPTNFQQDGAGLDIGKGVLRFDYTWESDSGDLSHLYGVEMREYVDYENDGYAPNPPFQWNKRVDPTPWKMTNDPTTGTATDKHTNNAIGECMLADETEGAFHATQYYRYRSLICTLPDDPSDPFVLDWGEILDGPLSITREIKQMGNIWYYEITKNGDNAFRTPLTICGE